MSKLKVLDLFSGIGGFSLGLERTGGFETVAFCEIEEYPRKVLKKHWPEVPIYEDVRDLTAERLATDGIGVNVITGGFPCQDLSVAGKQAGINAERSGLWSECARLLGEIRPDYAIFENVTALLSGDNGKWFQRVLWDISQVGYDAEWHCIPASELGAHHHRDRVWIIAYPNESAMWNKWRKAWPVDNGAKGYATHPMQQGLQRSSEQGIFGKGREKWQQFTAGQLCSFKDFSDIEPTICRKTNGLPNYMDRLKGLGNAVVPQIPELIGRAILEQQDL